VTYNPEIHHRHSIRLKGYDYTLSGAYFITIVTHERECLFGEITNGEMVLNKFGLIAQQMWDKLPARFRNVELGTFVVMPNHVHGIIWLDGTRRGIDVTRRGVAEGAKDSDDLPFRYAPTDDQSSRYAPTTPDRQFGKMIPGSIPAIVRAYKSSVAYRINLMRGLRNAPVWQRNYYEHILRNADEAERIQHYIESNPSNWAMDDVRA
jgi:REP element-mobilizing transposase RayT